MKVIDYICYLYENKYKEEGVLPGHNGLYKDKETTVRNMSHLIMMLCFIYKNNNSEEILAKINFYCDHLLNSKYISDFNYLFRTKKGKDQCNGVIGAAWVMESLISAYEITNRDDLLKRCEHLVRIHDFDFQRGLWSTRVEPDGTKLSMDCTLNHQLWFSALAFWLAKYSENEYVHNCARVFFSKFKNNIKFRSNGLVFHICPGERRYLKNIIRRIFKVNYRNDMDEKEYGYHLFNLMAVHIIRNAQGGRNEYIELDKFFELFQSSYNLLSSTKFKEKLENNKYGYPYNVSGFEAAVIMDSLGLKDKAQEFLDKQFEETYCFKTNTFAFTDDVETLTARSYELCYLNNYFDYSVPNVISSEIIK